MSNGNRIEYGREYRFVGQVSASPDRDCWQSISGHKVCVFPPVGSGQTFLVMTYQLLRENVWMNEYYLCDSENEAFAKAKELTDRSIAIQVIQ
jgi:hypothetical protein